MNIYLRHIFAMATIVLGGCSVKFQATKANPDAADFGKEPGFYYALPKTVLNVSIPATLKIIKGGELKASYDRCLLDNKTIVNCSLVWEKTPDPKLVLQPASVIASAVPDWNHLYYVNPDASWFRTVKHEFKFTKSGIVTEIKNTGTNNTFSSVLGTVAGLGSTFVKQSMVGVSPKTASKKIVLADCTAVSKEHLLNDLWMDACKKNVADSFDLIEKVSGTSWDISEFVNLQYAIDIILQKQKRELDGLLTLKGSLSTATILNGRKLDQNAVDIGHAESALKSLKAAKNTLLVVAHVLEEKETVNFALKSRQPVEVNTSTGPYPFEVEPDSAEVVELYNQKKHAFALKITTHCPNNTCASFSGVAPSANKSGYRYRLPVTADVVVAKKICSQDAASPAKDAASQPKENSNGKSCDYQDLPMSKTTVAIAQLGPVVAMPSTFYGTNAQLDFVLDAETGALISATLGQTAVDPKNIVDPVKSVVDALKPAAPAVADPLAAQTKANNLKQAQLCADALAAIPAPTTKPPICGSN